MKLSFLFVFAYFLIAAALAEPTDQNVEPFNTKKLFLENSRSSAPISSDPLRFCLNNEVGKSLLKKYNLTKSQVEISFDIKITAKKISQKAVVRVEWNNKAIHTILACDNGKSVQLKVNARLGLNTLKFIALGGQSCQVCIQNINLGAKKQETNPRNNLIKNGGFEQNSCSGQSCTWNVNTIQFNSVPNWIPNTQIEIGKGSNYNTAALGSNNWVAQLDSGQNTCIRQVINITPGRYILTFNYAASLGSTLKSSSLIAKFNGLTLTQLTPNDYNLNTQTVDFTLKTCPPESYFQFCGLGLSDSYGAAIDNVRLECYGAYP